MMSSSSAPPTLASLQRFQLERITRLEKSLQQQLRVVNHGGPRVLKQALEYSVLGGGKRFRPLLVYAIGEAYGQLPEKLDSAAVAIEFVHVFSLIHDDLPAMDDDTLRRGKPTSHLAFDEATAILAGDALLTVAFQVLVEDPELTAEQKVAMVGVLSRLAGPAGMAGGQYLDLHPQSTEYQVKNLNRVARLKTGALLKAALQLGAVAAHKNRMENLRELSQLADQIGLLFQLQDDINNLQGDAKVLGKNVGTDRQKKRVTYPLLFGLEAADQRRRRLVAAVASSLRRLRLEQSFLPGLINRIVA